VRSIFDLVTSRCPALDLQREFHSLRVRHWSNASEEGGKRGESTNQTWRGHPLSHRSKRGGQDQVGEGGKGSETDMTLPADLAAPCLPGLGNRQRRQIQDRLRSEKTNDGKKRARKTDVSLFESARVIALGRECQQPVDSREHG